MEREKERMIRHQENQCRRKIYFRAQSRAELAALAMEKKHAARSLKFKAYHCPWCEGWHVGHTDRSEQ